jgi:hypothetical protein
MKPDAHKTIEQYRIKSGKLASDASYGNNGAFMLPLAGGNGNGALRLLDADARTPSTRLVAVIVSDEEDWDHVSVSLPTRCPTWEEMCFIKDLFFEPHEVVMQLHPAKSEYVNHHPFCLHLWRPQNKRIPVPPTWMVGPRRGAAV